MVLTINEVYDLTGLLRNLAEAAALDVSAHPEAGTPMTDRAEEALDTFFLTNCCPEWKP